MLLWSFKVGAGAVIGLLVRPEFYETNEKAKQELS